MKAFILLLFFIVNVSLSYSQLDFIITPLKTIHKTKPGKKGESVFTVENSSAKTISISVSLQDFDIDEEKDDVIYQELGTHKNSLSKYISIFPDKFDLKPYQRQKVKYIIDFPKNVNGSFWCAVFFTSRPTEKIRGTGIKIAAQIVSYVFCNVDGASYQDLSVEKITERNNNFIIQVKNSGNAVATPKISTKITDAKGKIIQTKKIEKKVILPKKRRNFKIQLENLDKIREGRYSIDTLVEYEGKEIKESKKFIVKREWDEVKIKIE